MTIHIPAWVEGRLTPVEKLEAHIRGLRHKAISVFVMRGDKVLIQQRAMCKYHTPGLWANTCCTHPDWGEAADVCAERCLGEELGITGLTLHNRGRVEYRADVGNDLIEHEVVDIFVAEATTGLHMDLNPEEVIAVRWVSLDRLRDEVAIAPGKFTPWLAIYLERHSHMIFAEPAVV